MVGFTPWPIRHGVRDWLVSSLSDLEALQVGLHLDREPQASIKLILAPHGDHTSGSCQNHTYFGP